MDIKKEEIIALLKQNSISEEFAEQVLMELGKGIGNFSIDLIGLIVAKTPNQFDDMAFMAVENKLRELVKDLNIKL